jgi:hypothetical protein
MCKEFVETLGDVEVIGVPVKVIEIVDETFSKDTSLGKAMRQVVVNVLVRPTSKQTFSAGTAITQNNNKRHASCTACCLFSFSVLALPAEKVCLFVGRTITLTTTYAFP